MTIFPAGFGAQVTGAAALDPDDSILGNIDGGKANIATKALRGCTYIAASTGAAYTATRTVFNEDFLLTVNANTTITLAGGGVAGEISVWNIIFIQDATGGRTVTVSGVNWFDDAPTFTTTANTANVCMFMQHGTGQIYGYYGGAASSLTTYASDSFDRANTGSLGTSDGPGGYAWVNLTGAFQVFSNFAFRNGGPADVHITTTLSVPQNDVAVSADITLSGTLDRAQVGLTLRQGNTQNYLHVYLTKNAAFPNNIRITQNVAGSETLLAEVTSAGLANGIEYTLKAVILGTTIAVFVNGVQRIAPTAFNAALTSQKYGLVLYRSATTYDDGNSWWNNFLVTS